MSTSEQEVVGALDELADVINEKSGSTGKKTLSEMVEAARNIVTGTPTYAGDFTLAGDVKSIIVSTDVIDKAIEIYESGNLPYLKNSGALYKLTEYSSSGDSRSMQFAYTYSYDDLVGYWQAQLTYNVSTKAITNNVYSRYSNWSIQPNVAQQNSGALETLKFGDRVFSVGPTPNPQGESQYLLTSLGIWNTKYNLPNVLPNTAESSTRYLTSATINGAAYRVSNVTANPLGTASGTLSALNIDGTKYAIPQGTNVVANPTLAGTEANLTGLQVGDTKYIVPSGGGGSEVDYVTILDYDRNHDTLCKRGSTEELTASEFEAICLDSLSNPAKLNLVAIVQFSYSNQPQILYLISHDTSNRNNCYYFEGKDCQIKVEINGSYLSIWPDDIDNRKPLIVDVNLEYGEGRSDEWRYVTNYDIYDMIRALDERRPVLLKLYKTDDNYNYFTVTVPFNAFFKPAGSGSGAAGFSISPLNSNEGQVSIFLDILNALERIQDCIIFPESATTDTERRALNFSDLDSNFKITCNGETGSRFYFQYGPDPGGSGSGSGSGGSGSGSGNGADW